MYIAVDIHNNTIFTASNHCDILNCCYSVERFKYNNPNTYNCVYIALDNLYLNVTNISYPTMMYSKFLKLIEINSGASLDEIMYNDLDVLN